MSETTRTDVNDLAAALAEPFDPSEIGWKPQSTTKDGNKALAIAYIDARNVMDRLDAVVGPLNWQDEYTPLPNGNVVCRLALRVNGEWIAKQDVGGESDQRDVGDREKAAFSDALKRAAVKWGIARYLYNLDGVWVEYDSQRKQLKSKPKLPDWALPKRKGVASPPAAAQPAQPQPAPAVPQPASEPAPAAARKTPAKKGNGAPGLPADGKELKDRLAAYEARLVAQGLCRAGDLLAHVAEAGARAGHPRDVAAWAGAALRLAVEEVKAFEARARGQAPVTGAALLAEIRRRDAQLVSEGLAVPDYLGGMMRAWGSRQAGASVNVEDWDAALVAVAVPQLLQFEAAAREPKKARK